MHHGIADAYYVNTPNGKKAILQCICGQEFGYSEYWSETGAEFDEHLEDVDEGYV